MYVNESISKSNGTYCASQKLSLPPLAFHGASTMYVKAILIRDSLFVVFPLCILCCLGSVRRGPIYCAPIELAPSSVPLPISAPSLSALRFLFSSKLVLLSANSFSCLLSTPVNQYPKLPPVAAKTGYAQSDSLLKRGRISIPSCQNRTARPSLHGTD